MRRGWAAPALMAIFILTPAARADAAPREEAVVSFHLRATGRDAIDVCRHSPFEEEEAEALARSVADLLGLVEVRPVFSGDFPECAGLALERPLSEPGVDDAERVFSIDPDPLRRLDPERFSVVRIAVCTPVVPREVTRGGQKAAVDDSHCEYVGWFWEVTEPLTVSFRATAGSLGFGFFWAAVYVLGVAAAWRIVAGRLRVRDRWAWFLRRRTLGWTALLAPAAALSCGWVFLAYSSSLVHSLQLLGGIGVPGEMLVLGVPSLAIFGAPVWIRRRGIADLLAHRVDLAAKEARDAAVEPLDEEALDASPAGRRFGVFLFAPFWLAPVLLWAPIPDAARVFGGMALSLGSVLLGPLVLDRMFVRLHGYERVTSAAGSEVAAQLAALGFRVQDVRRSPGLVRGGREGGFRAASAAEPTGGAIGHRVAVVWDGALAWPVAEVVGGLVDAAGVSLLRMGGALAALLMVAGQPEDGDPIGPWPLLVAVGVLVVGGIATDALRRIRALRRAARGPDPRGFVRGMLRFARLEARGMASVSGKSGKWNEATQRWRSGVARARRVARRAGISEQEFEAIVADVLRDERP